MRCGSGNARTVRCGGRPSHGPKVTPPGEQAVQALSGWRRSQPESRSRSDRIRRHASSMRPASRRPSSTILTMSSMVRATMSGSYTCWLAIASTSTPASIARRHGLFVAVSLADRAHLEVIADDDPVAAEIAAQEPGDRRLRKRGWVLGVEPGVEDVGGQDGIGHAGVNQGHVRLELFGAPRLGDIDHSEMGVAGGRVTSSGTSCGARRPHRRPALRPPGAVARAHDAA